MKRLLVLGAVVVSLGLAGCTTTPSGQIRSNCQNGTNYGGAAVGAIGGALVGSLIGGGTGNTLATIGGAAAGGYAGSQTNVGCR